MESPLPVCAAKGCKKGSTHLFRDAVKGRLFGTCDDCWKKIRLRMAAKRCGL
jgi:hypothetical protein